MIRALALILLYAPAKMNGAADSQQQQQPYSVEVACPIGPAPMDGWDRLTPEQKHVTAKLLRHVASIPGFLGGAQVSLEEDRSVCVALFLLEDNYVTAELLGSLAAHQSYAQHVMHIQCDMGCRPVLNPHQTGAIMVYLRTSQYINSHPGRSTTPTQLAPPPVLRRYDPGLPPMRAMPGVPTDHEAQVARLADELLLLQGQDFQPEQQAVLCTGPGEYEVRTFGFARPITIAHLEQAARLPYVRRAHVSFYLHTTDALPNQEGCLVARCSLPHSAGSAADALGADDTLAVADPSAKRVRQAVAPTEPAAPAGRSLFSYFSAPDPPPPLEVAVATAAQIVTPGAPGPPAAATRGAPGSEDDDDLLLGMGKKRSWLGAWFH